MELHHLSASSAKLFEACEAQWQARYEGGGRTGSGDAADLGTALHEALELFLSKVDSKSIKTGWDQLYDAYKEAYWSHMSSPEMFAEGSDMLKKWYARQIEDIENWHERTVLSFEERTEMILETKYGDVPFVYIIDRLDQHADGEIEVIDYKSGKWQQNGYDLRHDIQARSYATAIWRRFPGQSLYWVTFDYLRNEPVGVSFRAAECEAHYQYLVRLAERIIESDGTQETLNSMCRFCIRKHHCKALYRYELVDGTATEDVDKLIGKRLELSYMQKAIEAMMADIDNAVKAELMESDDDELVSGDVTVRLTSRRSRTVDSEAVIDVIGPEAALGYIKVGASDIDQIIAESDSEEDVAALRKAISWRNGRSNLSYKKSQ